MEANYSFNGYFALYLLVDEHWLLLDSRRQKLLVCRSDFYDCTNWIAALSFFIQAWKE